MTCRHQVEIELWPARVQLNFRDEWTANPVDTQVRFEAIVYNSEEGYRWEVRDLDGNPGSGTIDASGLYQAPPKGTLASGLTEIIVATAREDPLRKAYAWVTLIGNGPEPAPVPTVEVFPKRVNLYYWQGADNSYIDASNKMRQFNAVPRHSASAVEWLVDGTLQPGTSPWFLYQAPGTGGTRVVTVRARLQAQPTIYGDAETLLLNYNWPGA
jgi:hypothetical protein